MKWFLRLFAVYFISLSLFPCSDSKDCDQPIAQEQTTNATEHAGHNDHQENCPPYAIAAAAAYKWLAFAIA